MFLIDRLARFPLFEKLAATLHRLYEHAYTLLRVRPLIIAFTLGITSWFCECVGLYLTVAAFGYSMGLPEATFIYAFATFFGAITLLPGGLGVTEGSLTGLAILHGVPKDAASAATIIIRVATLWFAVALGLLWLAPNREAFIPGKEEIDAARDG
jgi:uncharacterized protein (TIRG00374 family)